MGREQIRGEPREEQELDDESLISIVFINASLTVNISSPPLPTASAHPPTRPLRAKSPRILVRGVPTRKLLYTAVSRSERTYPYPADRLNAVCKHASKRYQEY